MVDVWMAWLRNGSIEIAGSTATGFPGRGSARIKVGAIDTAALDQFNK